MAIPVLRRTKNVTSQITCIRLTTLTTLYLSPRPPLLLHPHLEHPPTSTKQTTTCLPRLPNTSTSPTSLVDRCSAFPLKTSHPTMKSQPPSNPLPAQPSHHDTPATRLPPPASKVLNQRSDDLICSRGRKQRIRGGCAPKDETSMTI